MIFKIILKKKKSLLIISGSTFFQLSLMLLDEIQNKLVMLPQNLNDSLPNTFYMYSLEDIIIGCEISSITAYQIQWENITLKQIGKLKEKSGNLCQMSSFYMTKFDKEIHIKQIVLGNINLSIFDTVKNISKYSIIPQFDETTDVLKYQTGSSQILQIVIENTQNYGLIYMLDPIKKNIVNQVRFWNLNRDNQQDILFSYVKMTEIIYLFCGFEYKMFKIKMMNIKTLQITYEQEFPEISISFSDIFKFKYPIYYNISDSIVVHVQRNEQLTDIQSRYDFLFFKNKKGQISNDPNRYYLVNKLGIFGKNVYFSTQAEKLIIFYIVEIKYYLVFIYDNNGKRVLEITQPIYTRSSTLAQINEDKKTAIIFGYYIQITVNLTSLEYTTFNNTYMSICPVSYVLTPDFSKIYIQNSCGDNAMYFYPSWMSYYSNPISNTYVFNYRWYGNYLVFITSTTLLQIFDVPKVKFFQQISINGVNTFSAIWDTSAVFFNAAAVSHYDLATQQILLADDIAIIDQYIVITTMFRNNYFFGNQNLVQAKKYSEVQLSIIRDQNQSSNNLYLYCSFISELNYVVLLAQKYIRIYETIRHAQTLYKEIPISIYLYNGNKINFQLQELFTRMIYYFQPSDTIIIIYAKNMICLNASNFNIVIQIPQFQEQHFTYKNQVYSIQQYYELELFKSIVIDEDLGYLFSTNMDKDCLFNMKTNERKCYKEIETYTGVNLYDIPEYMQQLFLNKKTKIVIICQMTSIRLFSLIDLKYVGSIYNTYLNAVQFFYNFHLNYIIFTQKQTLQFYILDLSTLKFNPINLDPPPNKGHASTLYRFWFLSDKSRYIYLNAISAQIAIYSQTTHSLMNSIFIDWPLYAFSTAILDEERQYIFLIDKTNTVQHVSYNINKTIFKYQLNSTDLTDVQKNMIWDSYKQKLIVSSNSTLYVIGIEKQLIEFYFYDIDKIVQIQLIPNANLFQVSSYQSSSLFDYDYLIQSNKESFPNQIHPRLYKVNEDIIFHLSDYRCQANLFINKKIVGSWIRNNLFLCYIRIAENDHSKQLVYAIFDKEIVILDVSRNELFEIDQYFLTDNIIEVLYEDKNNVFLYSQSQQILTLQKKQQRIKINIVMSVSQGIGQYFFSKDSKQFIFTDQINNTSINIAQLNFAQNTLTGQIGSPLILAAALKDFKLINETLLVGLHANYLRLYDLQSQSQIKSITFPIKHNLTNIQIDYENSRIFVQNRLSGSLIYDFDLVQSPQKRINTFSNDLSFDQHFIYSVTSHSANIHFRKDLKFLINFRHFDSSLTLKKISYLGVGYIFMVEFITKLSIYEFSPITGQPLEKDFVFINQYSVIKYSLTKMKMDKNDNMYSFNFVGFTVEGMFEYSMELNIFSEFSDSCQLYFPLFDSIQQEQTTLNHLTQLFQDKKISLEKLQISIMPGQLLHLSNVGEEIISDNFGVIITGLNGYEYLYIPDSQISQNSIKYLYMKKIELKIQLQTYQQFIQLNKIPNSFEINKTLFPFLTQFFIEDMILNDIQLVISEIQSIVMKNITMTNSLKQSKNHLRSITKIKISKSQLIQIDQIIIESNYFEIYQPLLEITESIKVIISNIQIKDNQFQSLSKIISFSKIEQLEITSINISYNTINEITLILAKQINSLKIRDLIIKNLQCDVSNQNSQRILESNEIKIQRIIDLEEFQSLEIEQFQMDSVFSNLNSLLQILSISKVQQILNINSLNIFNIRTLYNKQGVIFSLKGINSSNFNDIRIKSIENLQFLMIDTFSESGYISYSSNILNMNNILIEEYKISSSNIINIYSHHISIQNFFFKNIQFDFKKSNIIMPAIKLKGISNIDIQNLNLDNIFQFNDSAISIYESANIVIQNSNFMNINSFGSGSVIKVLQSDGITLSNNIFQNNESKNGSGGAVYCQQSTILNMQSNQFNQNKVINGSGGAIYCYQSKILKMLSNEFSFNNAISGSGGAILLKDCDIEKFMNNTFISNSAFIGGSLRYLIKKPLFILNNDISLIKKQNIFSHNQYITYGKDLTSYPIILDVKNIEYHEKYSNIPIIKNVQSGNKAKSHILVRFVDEEMREVNFVDFEKYNYVISEIKEEFSLYNLQIESQQIGLLGDLKQSYSLQEFAFVFDVSYSFKPSDSSYIKIKSAQQLPQFIPNSQMMEYQLFEIQVQVNFRECQIGEVLQKNGNYTLCFTCEFGFYSISNPYLSNDISCKKCPLGSNNCSSSEIQVEDGYWRSGEDSDIIVHCSNKPESCSYSMNNTKNGCIQGFIGPLCEECDVKGQVWGDKYAKTNDFVCTNCKQFNEFYNILIFVLIFVFIISQVFYKVYKQVLATKKYILSIYLSKLGLISPSIQTSQTNSTSLIKILLNYFQFMMIVNSLNISIPIYFNGFSLCGGDTSQQTINRLDCLLFKYQTNIPNYVIRIIWVNLQPFVLFLFLEILSCFTIQNTQVQAQKQTLYTNLIVIFSFFQPSQVKVLSQSISCRKIGEKQYILSDLNEICLSEDHLYYFKSAILPLGIFWIFFGPLYLLYRMNHHKQNMETIKIIFNYGYLYQEYNHKHYYWDILKMFIRSFTIITINLFNFNVLLKGLIINGLIQFYITLLNKNKPYRVKKFNSLDQESCDLVNKTIFLLYVGYLCENEIVNIVIALLTISFNGLFILQMLSLIIIKPIPPIVKQRNIFEAFLYRMKQKFPHFFYWIKIGDINRTKVYILWKKVQRKLKENKLKESKLMTSNIEQSLNRLMQYNSDYEKPKFQKELKKSNFLLFDETSTF